VYKGRETIDEWQGRKRRWRKGKEKGSKTEATVK